MELVPVGLGILFCCMFVSVPAATAAPPAAPPATGTKAPVEDMPVEDMMYVVCMHRNKYL